MVYRKAHMSKGNIDNLFKICLPGQTPFSNANELYAAIDGLTVGGVPWQSFSVQYKGTHGDNGDAPRPKWMSDIHEVFYRDPRLVVHEILANPDFKDDMDFALYCVFDKDGVRTYQHLMSGNWAWEQAVSSPTTSSHWLNIPAHTSLNIGCDSSGSEDTWGNICSHHSRKRQDDGVSSDRPYGSISTIPIDW
jgi:Plavaka transposase